MQQNTTCPVCGTSITPGQTFCGSCGTKLTLVTNNQQSSVCPTCASPIKQGQQFCGVCGATLSGEGQQQWSSQAQPQMQAQSQQQQMVTQPAPATTSDVTTAPPAVKPLEAMPQSRQIKKRNHRMLLVSITILRIVGWISIIGGLIMAVLVALSDIGTDVFSKIAILGGVAAIAMIIKFIIVLTMSAGYGFGLLAFAELCKVLIGVESNTAGRGE